MLGRLSCALPAAADREINLTGLFIRITFGKLFSPFKRGKCLPVSRRAGKALAQGFLHEWSRLRLKGPPGRRPGGCGREARGSRRPLQGLGRSDVYPLGARLKWREIKQFFIKSFQQMPLGEDHEFPESSRGYNAVCLPGPPHSLCLSHLSALASGWGDLLAGGWAGWPRWAGWSRRLF